jgi:hypothetical protein
MSPLAGLSPREFVKTRRTTGIAREDHFQRLDGSSEVGHTHRPCRENLTSASRWGHSLPEKCAPVDIALEKSCDLCPGRGSRTNAQTDGNVFGVLFEHFPRSSAEKVRILPTSGEINLMNMLVKSAVAAALGLGATSAFAMGVPATNSSDLVLVVENLSTQATYALDTGILINTILPTANVVPGTTLGTSMPVLSTTIAASAALQSFLATNPAAGDSWTLEAGQYNGGGVNTSTNANSHAPGAAKMLFTSNLGTINNGVVNNFNLTNLVTFSNAYNTDITTGGTLSGLATGTETTGTALYGQNAQTKYSLIGAPDMSSVGTAAQFFGYTGNNVAGTLNSYLLGSATLGTDGTLSINAVPLPAAVWLFGSGLMGLVGVSRRRKAAV